MKNWAQKWVIRSCLLFAVGLVAIGIIIRLLGYAEIGSRSIVLGFMLGMLGAIGSRLTEE